MALSKSVIFSLNKDFEKKVVSLDAKNLAESWTGNWVESWVDNYEQEIDWENLIYAAHDILNL